METAVIVYFDAKHTDSERVYVIGPFTSFDEAQAYTESRSIKFFHIVRLHSRSGA